MTIHYLAFLDPLDCQYFSDDCFSGCCVLISLVSASVYIIKLWTFVCALYTRSDSSDMSNHRLLLPSVGTTSTWHAFCVTPGGVTVSRVTPGGVTASCVTPGGVTASCVTPGGVTVSCVTPGGVTASCVTPGGVTVSCVTPGGVTASCVTPGGVTTSRAIAGYNGVCSPLYAHCLVGILEQSDVLITGDHWSMGTP